jgi:hypothetical protein
MRNRLIKYAARSDIGRSRRNNEDNLFCCGSMMTEDTRNLPFKLNGGFTIFANLSDCYNALQRQPFEDSNPVG